MPEGDTHGVRCNTPLRCGSASRAVGGFPDVMRLSAVIPGMRGEPQEHHLWMSDVPCLAQGAKRWRRFRPVFRKAAERIKSVAVGCAAGLCSPAFSGMV